jgi:mannose-1-phosphate guanylyltransferase
MVLFRAPNPRVCGIAELDAAGRIVSFVEKPERPASNLANAGLYVVSAAAYREIAARNAFDLGFEVTPSIRGRYAGVGLGGYYLDFGTHAALERARHEAPGIFASSPTGRGVQRPAVFPSLM